MTVVPAGSRNDVVVHVAVLFHSRRERLVYVGISEENIIRVSRGQILGLSMTQMETFCHNGAIMTRETLLIICSLCLDHGWNSMYQTRTHCDIG